MIELHGWPTRNRRKIAIMLVEARKFMFGQTAVNMKRD